MVFYMPTFVKKSDLVDIEKALLNGETEFSYISCDGIDPDIYFDLLTLFKEHSDMNGKKIKEVNVNKKLKKLMRKLNFSGNKYDYE